LSSSISCLCTHENIFCHQESRLDPTLCRLVSGASRRSSKLSTMIRCHGCPVQPPKTGISSLTTATALLMPVSVRPYASNSALHLPLRHSVPNKGSHATQYNRLNYSTQHELCCYAECFGIYTGDHEVHMTSLPGNSNKKITSSSSLTQHIVA